jgi:hypothetical protein
MTAAKTATAKAATAKPKPTRAKPTAAKTTATKTVTVRVRPQRVLAHDGAQHVAGGIVSLPADEAAQLIRDGYVEKTNT